MLYSKGNHPKFLKRFRIMTIPKQLENLGVGKGGALQLNQDLSVAEAAQLEKVERCRQVQRQRQADEAENQVFKLFRYNYLTIVSSSILIVLTAASCACAEEGCGHFGNPCCPPPRCYKCRPYLAPQPHWGDPCPGDPSYYVY
jgi:hypothetical protein